MTTSAKKGYSRLPESVPVTAGAHHIQIGDQKILVRLDSKGQHTVPCPTTRLAEVWLGPARAAHAHATTCLFSRAGRVG